ncbi:MAG TPA: VWA domain-containing protein [Terriglobia bacterium]|nr:VWA domain-containing protein [Terriglobia bacterium]
MRPRFHQITICLLMLAFGFPSTPWSGHLAFSQSQNDQQSSQAQGPAAQPGETVIVPKKTKPSTTAPTPAPQTQRPEKINPSQVYHLATATNLVNVDVQVLDKDGDPINNLGKKNFRVYADGVEQSVSNFGIGDTPMTICLLIEFSNEYWPLLYQSIRESYDFLNAMKPNDWVAVVTFDLKPTILTDFTHDRNQVMGAINQLQFPGFSEICIYDALAFTINRMQDIKGRKAIIAIVSGYDTFSKLTYDKMLKIAKTSSTPIYAVSTLEWIAVRMPGGYNIDYWQARNGLNYIAKYSGGQAYFPRFEGEVPSIYQQIAGQLRQQYSIGFTPTDPDRNGKFHKLRVDLVDNQGNPLRIVNQKGKPVKYHLEYRPGYYSPKS